MAVEAVWQNLSKLQMYYISPYSKWIALLHFLLLPPVTLITCYVCYVHFGFCLGSQSLARAWHAGSAPPLFLRGWDDDRTSPRFFWFFRGFA